MTYRLISDERHDAAGYYDIPISHHDPRAWFYPDGFSQPATFAYARDTEAFGWVQKPNLLNLGGAAGRPRPEKVLQALRRQVDRLA